MKPQHLSVHARSSAPPDVIWPLLSDVSTWTTWAPFEQAFLEQPGADDPNGVGAVRQFHRGRYVTREEITEFVPGRRLTYHLLSGLPLDSYSATVELVPSDDGTDIVWSSTFVARIPGTGAIFRRGMERLYRQFAELLAAAPDVAAGTHSLERSHR